MPNLATEMAKANFGWRYGSELEECKMAWEPISGCCPRYGLPLECSMKQNSFFNNDFFNDHIFGPACLYPD